MIQEGLYGTRAQRMYEIGSHDEGHDRESEARGTGNRLGCNAALPYKEKRGGFLAAFGRAPTTPLFNSIECERRSSHRATSIRTVSMRTSDRSTSDGHGHGNGPRPLLALATARRLCWRTVAL